MKLIYSLILFMMCNVIIAQHPDVKLAASQMDQEYQDDNIAGKKIPLPDVLLKSNTSFKLKNQEGKLVWSYHIKSENAKGLVAYFDQLTLANNTQIRAYSPLNGSSTKSFHSNDNTKSSAFALPLVKGDEMIIEITCKNKEAWNQLDFDISEVGVLNSLSGFGEAPACFVNVNCSEGNPWQDQKRSVARYMTTIGGDIGFCTGVLVNNTSGDRKNYFLSAQHCSLGATASELGQYVFYFNYEAAACENPSSDVGLDQQTVVGCKLLAQSGDGDFGGGVPDASDFSLLEINEIPTEYNVYYAGWNRNPLNELHGNGAIIQHPRADLKKISFWDNVTPSATSTSHLYTTMVASENGDGIVEPMSSGSPIFDVNKQVIGNVTSGDQGCISEQPTAIAQAGRFEIHWDQCGTTENRQLKPWLDPANTGSMSLAGLNQSAVNVQNPSAGTAEVKLFPNPANEIVHIRSVEQIKTIELYNSSGILLYTMENVESIDVAGLAKGIYFLSIHTGSGSSTQRFLRF